MRLLSTPFVETFENASLAYSSRRALENEGGFTDTKVDDCTVSLRCADEGCMASETSNKRFLSAISVMILASQRAAIMT